MKNSLKEIIEGVISIVEGMDGLATVEYTTSYEIAVDDTKDFPRLFLIVNSPSNILEQYNQVSIDFLFLDIMTSDVDHIQKDYEIKSDMTQQASILFDILEDQGYFGEDINITLEPITGEYMDGLSGMGCTVPFAIEKPCFEDGVPVTAFMVTIDSPITGAEFEEGADITITQTFSRVNDDITRVDLVVDGVVEDSHFVAPFDADFILAGLELGGHSIYINAWEGDVLADKSNTVNLTVVRVPLILTINQPTEAEEFAVGDDVDVNYTFDRLAPEVDKVELWIDGALSQTDVTAPFDTFTISAVTEGNKLIEVKAYEGVTELAADSVNIEVVSAYDSDAAAYMAATGILDNGDPSIYTGLTNNGVWNVVNNLFLDLKSNGLYSKLQYLRPRVGGTAASHSLNALNVSQFNGTYFGGWVHDEMGSKGNATNTHMATGFNPSVDQVNGNSGFTAAILSNNTNDTVAGSGILGAYIADSNNAALAFYQGNKVIVRLNAGFTLSPVMDNRLGVYTISRVASATVHRTFKNGVFLFQGSGSGVNPNKEVYEGWVNDTWSRVDVYIGTTAAHEGLTDMEAIALHSIITTFENALGRKTW